MGWLEDYLAQYGTGLGALTQLAGTPQAPPVGQAGATPTSETGGTAAQPQDPAEILLSAYKAYRGTGDKRRTDPLLQEARRGYAQGTPSAPSDLRLLGKGKPVVTARGPRAGRAKFLVDMGGGKKASVYYTKKGKRQVFVY